MADDAATPQDTAAMTSQLQSLKAAATKEYSLRNYTAAADLYSEATEIQAELNGEMSPENADLLYAYGRCLYHVAVAKSDVLGGKVAGGEEPKKKKRKIKADASGSDAAKTGEEKTAEEVVEAVVEEQEGRKEEPSADNKPFFQITGDENWTDSEDSEDEEAADAEAEEEEDDFAIAYEILDVARVLLGRKLEGQSEVEGKGKAKATDSLTPDRRQIMERLADTHDLQAEISLENERFADAVTDSRAALELKLQLFPTESSLVAEAHYKLSLALEFASVTSNATEGEASEEQKPAQVDDEMRGEAATQMERAIESCKLRVGKEEASLAGLDAEKKKEKEKSIKDVKEMVADMEQRLVDLRNPAVNLNGVTGPAGAPDESNPLGGILGSILGESAVQQKARIEEATNSANDLTGLIRKKPVKPAAQAEGGSAVAANGKRKADEEPEVNGKKAKVEDAAEA